MNKLIYNILQVNNSMIIPDYVIKNYNNLDLEGFSFILLVYFINQKDDILFDINKISKDLNQESSTILALINELNEKNYISIEMKKINGVIEEYISTELFFNKINSLIVENEEKEDNSNIFSTFEKEFGRTLSPTECEIINGWLENHISEELIKEALKEAILSNSNNLRYIDRILFEWNKKGYKNVSDIKNKNTKKDDIIQEIYDYDWINE